MKTRNLSIEEVARWLEVSPKTVYRLVQKGKIPGFKVGNQWRCSDEMLKKWIAHQTANRVVPTEGRQVIRTLEG